MEGGEGMDIAEVKEVREVFGADSANELLQQGWVLLDVHYIHSGGREDGFSYLLGSAAGSDVPRE